MPTCLPTSESANEYAISGLEALLAGTLALMSAYAHGSCRAHQPLLSAKILSNLCCLQAQNCLSPEFRQVLAQVGQSWQQHGLMQTQSQAALLPSSHSFSLAAHGTVQ